MTAVASARPLTRRTRIGWLVTGVLTGAGMAYGLAAMEGVTIGAGTTASTPATIVAVATLCYLAAAATEARWVAWLAVPVFSALAFVAEFVPVPWWLAFALAGLLLVAVGLARGAGPMTGVQAVAMAGYYGATVLALGLTPRLGLALAGAALAAHAYWDLRHYRKDAVVHRSLALWCIGLDLTVGAICLTVALLG